MTVERPQQYVSLREAEIARPSLDTSAPITVQDFDRLVGAISFPPSDWVECQLIRRATGTVCRTKHGIGWIARRKDGREGFIGNICARRHFDDYVTLAGEASRLRRELRIDGLVRRIQSRLDDPSFGERVDAAIDQCGELRNHIRRNRERWPTSVLKRLLDMSKTGNSSIGLEICFVEKDENGRERAVWKPIRWRSVGAPGAVDPEPAFDLTRRLQDIRVALGEAKPSHDLKIKQLSYWASKLEDLEACEAQLQLRRATLHQFEDIENLKLLTWTVRQDDTQLAVVREVLRIAAGREPSEQQVFEAWRQWHREVRDAQGGRNFRIA